MHKQEGQMHKGAHAKLSLRPIHLPHFPSRKEQAFVTLLKARKPCVLFLQLQIQQHGVPNHPVPGGSCLLQSLSRGPRAARMMGMGWTCGWSPQHNPLIYLFIYLLTRPLLILWLLYFQKTWFLHTPRGGANPAICSIPLQQQPGLTWSSYLTAQGKAVL